MRSNPRSLGVLERRDPVTVGHLHVHPAAHQRAHRRDVGGPAVAEHDRLVQRGPAEPVDVVAVDARLQQPPHDPRVPALGRADQAGAVVGVLVVHARAVGERQLEQPRVVADLARRDQVRALLRDVLGVDVRALAISRRAASTSLANAASISRRSSVGAAARSAPPPHPASSQQRDGGERPHAARTVASPRDGGASTGPRGDRRRWEREVEFLRGLVTRRSTLGHEAPVQRLHRRRAPVPWDSTSTRGRSTTPRSRGCPATGPSSGPTRGGRTSPPRWPAAAEGGRSLVLQSHVDVVPATPEGRWTHAALGRRDRRRPDVGRGAADMKSGRRRDGLRRPRAARAPARNCAATSASSP